MNTTFNEYYISFVLFPQALELSIILIYWNWSIEPSTGHHYFLFNIVQMLHFTGDKVICNNLLVIIYCRIRSIRSTLKLYFSNTILL